MSWIATIDGNELDLERPAPAHITAFDIAWSLSQLTRFTGRANRPYSVAEHSLLVCEIAEREFGLDVHGQFAALMHDAHEAYCNDVATPAKALIGPAWAEWERHWERATQSAFAIVTASQVHRKAIKQADLIALATERRDLCIPTPSPWPVLLGVEPVPWVDLYSKERRDMGWQDWRDRWLDQHHALDFARTARLFAVVRPPSAPPQAPVRHGGETR